jgi:hypothetical protein
MGEIMFKTTDEQVRWQRRKKVARRDEMGNICVGRCACLFGIRSVDIYIMGCLFQVNIPVVGSDGNF